MNLDRIAVRARLRSPWESIDLGIALARRHWWPLFLVWLLPALPVFALIFWLMYESPGWAMLALWWLKPVYDRLPLFIASRVLFGETVTVSAALRQFFRHNRRDWLAWISWRRLSPTRSFDMPVTLLEQSSGTARAARLAVLHRKHANAASWLTITGIHLESFLWMALLALVYLLIPAQVEINWMELTINALWLEWLGNGVMLLIMAAVAPFYVVSGFCLYIGRRIELEGWDIEIHFRNLRERHRREQEQRRRQRAPVATTLLLLGALGLIAGPAPQVRAEAVTSPAEARETIDQVLAGEDFHRIKTINGWRLKKAEQQDSAFPQWLIDLLEWLESRSTDNAGESNWGPLVGLLLELLLWLTAGGLVVWILWRYRDSIRQSLRWQKTPRQKRVQPETLFGLDLRRESLPNDICAEVLRLWHGGEQRDGLGLLYRATLVHLIEGYQFNFGDHLTESECARLVQERQRQPAEQPPVNGALSGLVQQLTQCWQQLAYAHRAPHSERVQSLCDQWREVFEHGP